jgi:hypothetical protein
VWRLGALLFWISKLRKINGPNFTWPLLMFCGLLPEGLLARMGKIYGGRPLHLKSRKELLTTIKRPHWKYLRPDNGDLPDGWEVFQGSESASSGAKPAADSQRSAGTGHFRVWNSSTGKYNAQT